MRFGIWPSTARPWHEILELARRCEATGWDSVYLADHFMPHPDLTTDADQSVALDGDKLECWSVLAALATTVPRVRLGTLVSSVTFRHPAVLANMAAAVDNVSGGRLVLGIGAGWQLNEHASYGIELGSVGERLDRFEEACEVITSLLRKPRTTFHGRYYEVLDAPNQPAPVQSPLPLLIGGGGESARCASRRATQTCGTSGRRRTSWPTSSACCTVIATHSAATRARSWCRPKRCCSSPPTPPGWPESATSLPGRSIVGTPAEVAEIVGRYQEAGAGELIIPDSMAPLSAWQDTCDLFMEQVASRIR